MKSFTKKYVTEMSVCGIAGYESRPKAPVQRVSEDSDDEDFEYSSMDDSQGDHTSFDTDGPVTPIYQGTSYAADVMSDQRSGNL